MKWLVGYWNEIAPREINRCPSYYAADHEKLETIVGSYPIHIRWCGGFDCPMIGNFFISIPCTRLDGCLYSGFCGVNFAAHPMEVGEMVEYGMELYHFNMVEMMDKVTVREGMEWVFEKDYHKVLAKCRTMTWDDVRARAEIQMLKQRECL
jgi:hypothetical protein